MNPPEIQFNGIRRAILDQHRRLYLGARWHLNKDTTLYLAKFQPCIRAYSNTTYAGMTHAITDSNILKPNIKRMLVRLLESKVRRITVGSRNRISIPLDFVKLIDVKQTGTATLVGRGDSFEIWNPVTYEKYMCSARRNK